MKNRACAGALAIVMAMCASSRLDASGGCCLDDGTCIVVASAASCQALAGLYKGDGTNCLGACPRACCLGDGTCVDTSAGFCNSMGGATQGAGNFCFAISCLGACCLDNGTCVDDETLVSCNGLGGLYQGNDSLCAGITCPQPGACCYESGSCAIVSEQDCFSTNGVFQGEGLTCQQVSCPILVGACCNPFSGSCTVTNAVNCEFKFGGNYLGDGVPCTAGACVGACCDSESLCTVTYQYDCESVVLGTYYGNGTTCSPIPCPQPGACCGSDGSCIVEMEDDCTAGGGIFQGEGLGCTGGVCPQPGACCLTDGSCTSIAEPFCPGLFGSFHGELSSCAVVVCPLPGAVLSELKISDTQGSFDGVLVNQDQFGTSVASIGDLDGDGIDDLAVGAARPVGGSNQNVWILFLDAGGTVETEQKIGPGAGGFVGALSNEDAFGHAVAGIGDLDGDGVEDLAVGAWGDDDGQLDAGAVWILFLNSNGTVASHVKISATSGGFDGVLAQGDQFGWAVSAIGDLDGDGVGDLAVGAPGDDTLSADRGAVWVLFMNDDGSVASDHEIDCLADPLIAGNRFGSAVGAIDDLDGDGRVDLAIGAPMDRLSMAGHPFGAVWITFLAADGAVNGFQRISDDDGGLPDVLDPNDEFGRTVASPGDLNGDGHPDLVVGAPGDDETDNNIGALWVLFLEPGGTAVDSRFVTEGEGGFGGGLSAVDAFGISLGHVGDLDGDGVQDVAVGAWGDDDGGPASNRGAVWLLMLDGAGDVVFQPIEEPAAGSGNHEATGDFDEDGLEDVVIVIPEQDQAQVFLNDGTNPAGDWLGLTALAPIAVGDDPNGVAVALLDGDDHLDLVVANTSDDDVRILLGDGTGTFTFDIDVPVGVEPVAVAAADLTGDAQVDIVVANSGDDTVMILENVTALASAWQLKVTIPVGNQPVCVEPEDVDNDKDMDLVLGLKGDAGAVTVLLLQGGTLQAQQTVLVGAQPVDLASGDLDGDGDADAATANSADGTVSVIPNETGGPALGPVIYGSAQTVLVGVNPVSVEMADLDADGDLDLAVVAEDVVLGPVVQVLENHTAEDGAIVISPSVSIAIGADPNYVVAADLDGDGVSDLVTVNTDDTPGGGSVTGLITLTCPGDINGDGVVGFADITQLLLAWGPCPPDPAPCPYDIDGNGNVGFADLTLLLLAWGDCS